MALVAATLTYSCSTEPIDEPTPPLPQASGYFAVTLALDDKDPATRAYTGEALGSIQERLVDELYIMLYRQSDGTLAYRIPVAATNNSSSTVVNFSGAGVSTLSPAASDRLITIGYQVATAPYHMVVMANPTASMKAATVPATFPLTLSDFKTTTANDLFATFPTNTTTIVPSLRFPMTNSRGEVAVSVTDLKPSQAAAEAAPIAVALDRTVAKIETVKTTGASGFDANMTALIAAGTLKAYQNLSWDLDVTNKLSYYLRGKANTSAGTPEVATDARSSLYATDPNMAAIAVSGTTPYTTNFTAATINNTYLTSNPTAKTITTTSEPVYALENTFNIGVQATGTWETQATNVVVKVQIIPGHQALNATDWTVGYYSIDGFVFTHAEAVTWVNEIIAIPSGAPVNLTVSNLKLNDWFWNGSMAITSKPIAYSTSNLGASKLVFHYNSWNVYRIPIKHFDTAPTNYGHYGVVRNNWYKVSINSISGPGSGSSDKFISADVTILQWLSRNQIEDL